jgi:2-(1,2-epoxy-1,2-dihydrophenyl)acetyl-CoA isomerase
MAEPDSPVLKSQQGAVLTVTLNRPQALNSFNGAMHDALLGALKAASADAAVRCVVLTGAGRGFCAGQDLSDPEIAPDLTPGATQKNIGNLIDARYKPLAMLLADFPVPVLASVNGVAAGAGATQKNIGNLIDARYKPLAMLLADFPVPVLASVNGVAAGAGANLALTCDIVIAARSASFIQAFSKIGLIPDVGGTWLLPRLVGRANAMALAMLGDKLPAEQAERIGMIWRCVDDAALAEETQAIATRLASMPVRALVETRKAMARSDHMNLSEALSMEAEVQGRMGMSHDYIEGVTAFFGKRSPAFTDR